MKTPKMPADIRKLIAEYFPELSAEDLAKQPVEIVAVYTLARLLDDTCAFNMFVAKEFKSLRQRTLALETALGGPEAIAQAVAAQTGQQPQQGEMPAQPQPSVQAPSAFAGGGAAYTNSTISPGTAAGRPDPTGDGAWVMGGIDPETAKGDQMPPDVAAAFAGQPGMQRPAPAPSGPVVPGAPPSAPTAGPNPLPPEIQAALAEQARMAEAAAAAQQAPFPQPGAPAPQLDPSAIASGPAQRRRPAQPNGGK